MPSVSAVQDRSPATVFVLRSLRLWGHRSLLRLVVYALALGGLSITPARVYTDALAWVDNAMGPPGTASPSGTLMWFRVDEVSLEPLNSPEVGPDIVGLDFSNASTRVHPPGRDIAFSAVRIWLGSATWADPAQQPPPDRERMARMLASQLWINTDPPYTFTALGGGVYEARYTSTPGVRAFARAQAWPLARKSLFLAAIALLVGESLAFLGRRAVLIRPGSCRACGYPLADLPSQRCPECGSPREGREGTESPS